MPFALCHLPSVFCLFLASLAIIYCVVSGMSNRTIWVNFTDSYGKMRIFLKKLIFFHPITLNFTLNHFIVFKCSSQALQSSEHCKLYKMRISEFLTCRQLLMLLPLWDKMVHEKMALDPMVWKIKTKYIASNLTKQLPALQDRAVPVFRFLF